MIEANVDYLQFSAIRLESNYKNDNWQLAEGSRFYRRSYKNELGERVYFGNVNPKASDALIVLSGQPLYNMSVLGIEIEDYLKEQLDRGANVSRLDIAFTEFVEDDLIRVDDFETWVKQGKVISSHVKYGAKKIEEIKEDNVVQTLYIGDMKKRGKRGIFRAYDKGLEWNLEEYMITRIELEERGENAHNSAKRIAAGNSLASVFKSRLSVDDPAFDRVVLGDAAKITRGGKLQQTDEIEAYVRKWEWLQNQVAPALYDAVQDSARLEGKGNRLYWFLRRVGIGHDEAIAAVYSIQPA